MRTNFFDEANDHFLMDCHAKDLQVSAKDLVPHRALASVGGICGACPSPQKARFAHLLPITCRMMCIYMNGPEALYLERSGDKPPSSECRS